MTNEQASKVIQQGLNDFSIDYLDNEQLEALNMAIQALQADRDLISRQETIKHFREGLQEVFDKDDICYELEYELPSVAIPTYKNMTNAEVFAQVFGTNLKRESVTKSWWEQKFNG